jgi:hypothetical protein
MTICVSRPCDNAIKSAVLLFSGNTAREMPLFTGNDSVGSENARIVSGSGSWPISAPDAPSRLVRR